MAIPMQRPQANYDRAAAIERKRIRDAARVPQAAQPMQRPQVQMQPPNAAPMPRPMGQFPQQAGVDSSNQFNAYEDAFNRQKQNWNSQNNTNVLGSEAGLVGTTGAPPPGADSPMNNIYQQQGYIPVGAPGFDPSSQSPDNLVGAPGAPIPGTDRMGGTPNPAQPNYRPTAGGSRFQNAVGGAMKAQGILSQPPARPAPGQYSRVSPGMYRDSQGRLVRR